jgi:DNA-binding NarL/FixJ family response regulator
LRASVATRWRGRGDMSAGVPDQAAATTTPEVRVAVADERRMIAEAFAALVGTLPGFSVTAVIACAADVWTIAAHPPDLVFAGVDPGSKGGFDLVRSARAEMPEVAIVIVADALEGGLVKFVLEQRLGGLLLTDMSGAAVRTSLDEIVHGVALMPVGWQDMLAGDEHDPLESLSGRQLEVLGLLADGWSYDEIGTRLFITLNTVKFHVRSIFSRLGVANRTAAARVYSEHSASAPNRGRAYTSSRGSNPPERVRRSYTE